jgi:hypothetical protein
MGKVYTNSTVTIAADGLPDPKGGCHAPLDFSCNSRNVSTEIRCINEDGVECRVYVRREWDIRSGRGDPHYPSSLHLYTSIKDLKSSKLNTRGKYPLPSLRIILNNHQAGSIRNGSLHRGPSFSLRSKWLGNTPRTNAASVIVLPSRGLTNIL